MSRTPALSSFFGIGSWPHSGMPGPPFGPPFLSTRTWSGVTSRSSRSTSRRHVVVVLERDRLAAVLQEALVGGGRLHHAAARREIAGEHRGRALRHRAACRADG